MISSNLTSIIKESLAPRTEFWDSSKAFKVLAEESYFKEKDSDDVEWPDALKTMMSDSKCQILVLKSVYLLPLPLTYRCLCLGADTIGKLLGYCYAPENSRTTISPMIYFPGVLPMESA